MISDPRHTSYPHLGFHMGFSRLFTADVVDLLRQQPNSFTVEDLLSNPAVALTVIRAAGADSLKYERSAARRHARVVKWLNYFATTGRPLPTHDGRDDAVFIHDPQFPGHFKLVSLDNVAAA